MTAPESATVVERPPEGPARGALPAPVWLVVLLTASLVLLCSWALLRAWRRRAK